MKKLISHPVFTHIRIYLPFLTMHTRYTYLSVCQSIVSSCLSNKVKTYLKAAAEAAAAEVAEAAAGYIYSRPTNTSTISELQDQEISEFYAVQERRATDFEAPKLGKGSSGEQQ